MQSKPYKAGSIFAAETLTEAQLGKRGNAVPTDLIQSLQNTTPDDLMTEVFLYFHPEKAGYDSDAANSLASKWLYSLQSDDSLQLQFNLNSREFLLGVLGVQVPD